MRTRLLAALTLCLALLTADRVRADSGFPELKGLAFGASVEQTLARIKSQGGIDATFADAPAAFPLGLTFHEGATVYSWDSGIVLKKAGGFPPLYFHKGALIGFSLPPLPEDRFYSLKDRFPAGRFMTHAFPGEKRPGPVFTAQFGDLILFTDRSRNLFVFHKGMLDAAIAQIGQSRCWHIKLTSPNLARFVPEYTECVAHHGGLTPREREADLAACQTYCQNTPEVFSSPECQAYCRAAIKAAKTQ